jgi:circadian clock protein KaiC
VSRRFGSGGPHIATKSSSDLTGHCFDWRRSNLDNWRAKVGEVAVGTDNQKSDRIQSGIPGMDLLLGGGFLGGRTYLILGSPGCGKTILANQLAFYQCAQGGRSLYVTLLAESHSRMFNNLDSMSFFKREVITESIQYISGYNALEKDGLEGLSKLIGQAVKKNSATMLFIDGLSGINTLSESDDRFKKFLHNLNSVVDLFGCTTFLLSSSEAFIGRPELTMVDGIIGFNFCQNEMITNRQVEIRKLRGSPHLSGKHHYKITGNGLVIFPRVEAILGHSTSTQTDISRQLSFGVTKLDKILNGGVTLGSLTSLLGPGGTGKTLLGLQYLLSGAEKGENGLHVGFYEPPERLRQKAEAAGLNVSQYFKKNILKSMWFPSSEYTLDEIILEIMEEILKSKIQRLFLDGLGGLKASAARPSRIPRCMIALAHELRKHNVTTVFTEETRLSEKKIESPISDLSAVTDNILYLHRAEYKGLLRICLAVMKARDTALPSHIYEFKISKNGLDLGVIFKNVTGLIPTSETTGKRTRRGAGKKR